MADIWGLTGPTGAGKTTVSQIFAQQGCIVIDCDKTAREVTNYNVDCLKDLCYAFGSDIVNKEGILNRTLLAQRAFVNQEQTHKLNRITHPWILKEIHLLIEQYQKQKADVILLDAPTLFESGLNQNCYKTIAVLAPEQVRLKRIIQRDGLTKEQALLRIRIQKPNSFYISQCDIVLDGCLARPVLSKQIADLLREAR